MEVFMPVRKITISRNDDIYECFPDVVRTKSGKLICIYRESDSHGAKNFSHLVMRESIDNGETWDKRKLLNDSYLSDGVLFKWNCPRIVQMRDDRVLALCDGYSVPPGESFDRHQSHVYFWWSEDDGKTWSELEKTPVIGIVPDKLIELPSGTWLLGSHANSRKYGTTHQFVHRSEDGGRSWEGPITICEHEKFRACEGSILPLPDGQLVCYMRENSGMGWSGLKCFSNDEGKTWDGPYETLMDACHRPVAGILPSGKIMVTYRHQPGGAGYWAKNFFAYLETLESAKQSDRRKQRGIILPLDHDRSQRSDSSYSGWVVLPDGNIFAVRKFLTFEPKYFYQLVST
jgi:sialidase-1